MRIDKYLWAVRLFKTRSLAAQFLRQGRISIADELVKPSREVKPGDEISLRKGAIHFAFKVMDIPKNRVGAKLVPDYLKDITAQSELDKLEAIRLANAGERLRGLGRPTKKDRRNLDSYFE